MKNKEQYIKMCDTPVIQQLIDHDQSHVFGMGDFYATSELGVGNVGIDPYWANIDHPLWLPSQDQLQEMLGTGNEIYSFATWCNPETACLQGDRKAGMFNHEYCSICIENRNYKRRTFTSMEQLWLAFYMFEKYSKVWDGDKWVSAN